MTQNRHRFGLRMLLVLTCCMVAACEDRGKPYRAWDNHTYAVVDDVLFMAMTREYGRVFKDGTQTYFRIERMDCYVLEYPWPLQSDVTIGPINGMRIDDCGGALTSPERWPYEARQFIHSLEQFRKGSERQFNWGLPREVDAVVEQNLETQIPGSVFASVVVDGRELFLIRSRRLDRPHAIMTGEGEVVYELPVAPTIHTIWFPAASTIVFFDDGRDLEDEPPLFDDPVRLKREVIVYNYAVGDVQRYSISERKTAEFLRALEKEGG